MEKYNKRNSWFRHPMLWSAIALSGVVVYAGVAAMGWPDWMYSEGAPSWVQAVGSILAIIATGVGVEWQHQRQQMAAREERRLRLESLVRSIGAEAQKALYLADYLKKSLETEAMIEMTRNANPNLIDEFARVQVTLDSVTFRDVPIARVLQWLHAISGQFGRIRAVAHTAMTAELTQLDVHALSVKINRPVWVITGHTERLKSFRLEEDEDPA